MKDSGMILAHFGTFDVDNYGDLLFPLLLEKRMSERGIMCVHISPTGLSSRWIDARQTISLKEASHNSHRYTFVMLGGGNTFRADPTSLAFYASSTIGGSDAYPSLWLSAFSIAHQNRAPLCWNAPGVPRPIRNQFTAQIEQGTRESDYIAVRDTHSRENLVASLGSGDIHVVPDTALEIRNLWGAGELDESYEQMFREIGQPVPERSLIISLKRKYTTLGVLELSSLLDRISNYVSATPIVLALGPCHGDDDISKAIAFCMKSGPLVRIPKSLREAAACISHATQYLGSSLHGAITAISFGVPTLIVADESRVPFRKFSGFLCQVGMESALVDSWSDAERAICSGESQLLGHPKLDTAYSSLEEHWTRVNAVLNRRGRHLDA